MSRLNYNFSESKNEARYGDTADGKSVKPENNVLKALIWAAVGFLTGVIVTFIVLMVI